MKYAVFFLALLAMPPLGVALSFNRRWMKYAVWAMIGALAVYQNTAINFFSYEEYRGSSRGMEVSVVYLLAFALLVAAFPTLFRPLVRFSTLSIFFCAFHRMRQRRTPFSAGWRRGR